MIGPQRCHALARPAIAVTGEQAVPVENAGDQIIVRDEDQLSDGGNDVLRGAVALAAPPPPQTKFGVSAAGPMNQEHGRRRVGVDIGYDLANNGPNDALLEARIRRRRRPDSPEIIAQGA